MRIFVLRAELYPSQVLIFCVYKSRSYVKMSDSSKNDVSSLVYTSSIPSELEGYVVDTSTGELIYKGDESYSVPVDISTITNKGKFDQMVKDKLAGRKYRLVVSHVLLDLIVDKSLSIGALSVFCYLGQNIGYNNMTYTSIKSIQEGTSYGRDWVYMAIDELKTKGLLREVEHKLEGRADRMFLVNPVYFFLGYYPHKDNLIRDWIKDGTILR